MTLTVNVSGLTQSEFGVIITSLPGNIAYQRYETALTARVNLVHEGFVPTGITLDDDTLPATRHFETTRFLGQAVYGYRFSFGIFGCINGGTYIEPDPTVHVAHVPDLRESRVFVESLTTTDRQQLLNEILAKFEELM